MVSLEEWLKHSQKKECTVCKSKFAIRTVYPENMPRIAPVATTAREVLARVRRPLATSVRVLFAWTLWLVVLPLVSYWAMRLLMRVPELIPGMAPHVAATPTAGSSSSSSTPWANGRRFVRSTSWKHWYLSHLTDAPNDVVMHIGLYTIPNGLLGALYTIASICLRPALYILGRPVSGLLPLAWTDSVTDSLFEILVQALEGAPLVFFGLSARAALLITYKYVASKYETRDDQNAQDTQDADFEDDADAAAQEAPAPEADEPAPELGGPEQPDANANEPAADVADGENQEQLAERARARREMLNEIVNMNNIIAEVEQIQERVQELEVVLEARRQDQLVLRVDIGDIVLGRMDRQILRWYVSVAAGVQVATAVGIWLPFMIGQALVCMRAALVLDYPAGLCPALYAYLVNAGALEVACAIGWAALLRVLEHLAEKLNLEFWGLLAASIYSWATINGTRGTIARGISSSLATIQSGVLGAHIAEHMYQAAASTAGTLPGARKAAVNIGVVAAMAAIRVASGAVLAWVLWKPVHRPAWIVHNAIGILAEAVLFVGVMPVAIGAYLHLSLAIVLPAQPLGAVVEGISSGSWALMVCYASVGLFHVAVASQAASLWRRCTRPGFLWFVGNSDNKDGEALAVGMAKPLHAVLASALKTMASVVIVYYAGITLPLFAAVKVAPEALSAVLDGTEPYFGHSDLVLIPAAMAVLALARRRIAASLAQILTRVSAAFARSVRMTEYVTGERCIADEGRWTLKAMPWLPLPVVPRLALRGAVERAFASVEPMVDLARDATSEWALPTDEYRAHVQEAIDRELATVQSPFAFTFEPRNVRAPGAGFTHNPAGRKTVVELDDYGKPKDPLHDYETADRPHLRRIAMKKGVPVPPPAKRNGAARARFRREEHCVVYLPPMCNARELAYCSAIVFAMGAMLVAALIALGHAGRLAAGLVPGGLSGVLSLVSAGIIAASLLCAAGRGLLQVLHRVVHARGGRWAALREAARVVSSAAPAAWKVAAAAAVFAGVIPALACYALELYCIMPYMHYVVADYALPGRPAGALQTALVLWKRSVPTVVSASVAVAMVARGFRMWALGVLIHLNRSPHRWQVRRLALQYAAPAIGGLAALCLLPFGVAGLAMAHKGAPAAGVLRDMALFRDHAALVPFTRLAMLALAAGITLVKAAALYASCAALVRNRLYTMRTELANVDGTSEPNRGRAAGPEPAM
ncbi:hypothetical protein H4R18_002221 [Coemansia javaensis]|uniref:RING-type E3 ubiquitin transferase n=1 Tax=Coemansia javaensis TaxID=2761396 RepID=A0A9W8HBF7_9FUNG|nr:hypothetical protein H4R18_002221 [Coemansia javaensis]